MKLDEIPDRQLVSEIIAQLIKKYKGLAKTDSGVVMLATIEAAAYVAASETKMRVKNEGLTETEVAQRLDLYADVFKGRLVWEMKPKNKPIKSIIYK